MSILAPNQLLLGSARLTAQQMSLNAAAWATVEQHGLVKIEPAQAYGPPYRVVLTDAGRKALYEAAQMKPAPE